MPMYIKDDAVDDLAKRLMKLSGARSKTDAVRTALRNQMQALRLHLGGRRLLHAAPGR